MACGSCKKPEVHHIVPVHLAPELELDPENLITLCDKYCHFIFGHLMNYKSWNVDVLEDSKTYLKKIKDKPYK
jgi:5-methylcytosine-specific restriction endonuclease McrA